MIMDLFATHILKAGNMKKMYMHNSEFCLFQLVGTILLN